MLNRTKLISLIEKTINLLDLKYWDSKENIILDIMFRYKETLEKIKFKEIIETNDCKKIINLTRMYMETSSNYNQEFLYAMYDVENFIKINMILVII